MYPVDEIALLVGLMVAVYLLVLGVSLRKYQQNRIPIWLLLLVIVLPPFALLLWTVIFGVETRSLRLLYPSIPVSIVGIKRLIGWSFYGFILVTSAAMESLCHWILSTDCGGELAVCSTLVAALIFLVALLLIDYQLNKSLKTYQ